MSKYYSRKRPLTNEELWQIIENVLSDIEYLNDDDQRDDGWEKLSDNSSEDNDQLNHIGEEQQLIKDQQAVDSLSSVEILPETYHVTAESKQQNSKKRIEVSEYLKNNDLTAKTNIKSRKDITYITPNINWYSPENSSNPVELQSPVYFFRNT